MLNKNEDKIKSRLLPDSTRIEYFTKLIDSELAKSELLWPDYHSHHEGYAVLKEEMEELTEELDTLQMHLDGLWQKIRTNEMYHYEDNYKFIDRMGEQTIKIVHEAIQVSAILLRYKRLFERSDS